MTIKLIPFGLTSSVILSTLITPAYSQINPIQNAEQSVSIRGNNNRVNQNINQTIIFQSPWGRTDWSPRLKKLKDKTDKFGSSLKKYRKKSKDYHKFKGWKKGWYRGGKWDDDDD